MLGRKSSQSLEHMAGFMTDSHQECVGPSTPGGRHADSMWVVGVITEDAIRGDYVEFNVLWIWQFPPVERLASFQEQIAGFDALGSDEHTKSPY